MNMRARNETLWTARAELERALAARTTLEPAAWVQRLEVALSDIEHAVDQQSDTLSEPEGVARVGTAPDSSSRVDRRADRLHRNLIIVFAEARDLRGRILQLTRNPEPSWTEAELDSLRGRMAALAGTLKQYEQAEAKLILEVATTEVGAGD
jgi:hypothetical protein